MFVYLFAGTTQECCLCPLLIGLNCVCIFAGTTQECCLCPLQLGFNFVCIFAGTTQECCLCPLQLGFNFVCMFAGTTQEGIHPLDDPSLSNSKSSVTKTRGHYYCQYVRLLMSRVLRSPRLSTFKSRLQYNLPLD